MTYVIAISVVLLGPRSHCARHRSAAALGLLAPNRWVGIRTAEALKDEQSFRLANKIAAPTTILAGVLLAGAGLSIYFLSGLAGSFVAVVAIVTAIVVAGFGAAVGSKSAKTKAPVGGCGQACGGCSLRDACESPS